MRKRRIYFYSSNTPFASLGFALLALGIFFLTLPILIAALVVFGAVGAYLSWRINKVLKEAEKELKNSEDLVGNHTVHSSEIIIDITPETKKPKYLPEDERN